MSRVFSIQVILLAAAAIASPSLASAQTVSTAPTISGSAVVGATLTASGGNASGPSGTTYGYQWLRCTHPTSESACDIIDGAEATTYKLTGSDLGKRMRVARWASRGRDLAYKMSAATAAVGPAPTPTPTPTATPVKTPTATDTPVPPAPTPVTGTEPVGGSVQPTPEVQPTPLPEPTPAAPTAPQGAVLGAVQTRTPKMLKPFPLVRISGRLTQNGANISLLTVRAPKGASIRVDCTGKGCPRKRVAKAAKVLHVQQFERELRAGIRLRITIAKPGYITKVTTISIRKGKAPLRSDQCRMPGATKLIRCPKA